MKTNLTATREELVAMAKASNSLRAKSETKSQVSEYFNIKKLYGTWSHADFPNVEVVITKLNQFDARSMTLLFDVKSQAGEPLPRALFGDLGENADKDQRNLSLGSILKFVKLTPSVRRYANTLSEVLRAINSTAANNEGCGKGYATPALFEKHYLAAKAEFEAFEQADYLAIMLK